MAINPNELLKTIYLGDRCIKKIIIDGFNEKIAIQCDLISRVQPGNLTWYFYDKEDIENGFLVFNCAKAIKTSPLGAIADDYISSINITPINYNKHYLAQIFVGGYDNKGHRCEVIIEIEFSELLIQKTYDES